MKLYSTINIFTLVLLTVSCIKLNETENKIIYNEAFDNNINLNDTSLGYVQILRNALKLNEEQFEKIKKITKDFRKKRSGANEKQVVNLKKERQKQVNQLLNERQILQKRFVDAKIFKIKVGKNDLNHPINIQRKLEITDGEMLKLLDIKGWYQKEKTIQLANIRIDKVVGEEKTKKCRKLNFLKQ